MTTFNQIGFDSYNYFFATLKLDQAQGKVIMLAVEGTPGLKPKINIGTKSVFPLNGTFVDSYFTFESKGFLVEVTGVSIALDTFRLSGVLNQNSSSEPLNAYAEATCSNIEFFGFALDLLGLCHPNSGKMILNGTALLEQHTDSEGYRPEGLTVADVAHIPTGGQYGGGMIEAQFDTNQFAMGEVHPIIVMVDPVAFEAVDLAYGFSTEKVGDGNGYLAKVRLHLPVGFDPTGKSAYVVANLYPLQVENF